MAGDMDFNALLWHELEKNDLVIGPAEYKVAMRKIMGWGVIERENIIKIGGIQTWKNVLNQLSGISHENDCIRVLGFGRALTEYLVAPLNIPSNLKEQIVTVGVISNLYGSIYDHLIDAGLNNKLVLPRWALHSIVYEKRGLRLTVLRKIGPSTLRFIQTLVEHNIQILTELPYYKKHSEITESIKELYLQLYDAEIETIQKTRSHISEDTLKNKTILFYLIGGLYTWLCIPQIHQDRFEWHIKWVRQFGEFIAWMDDAVDLAEDISTGQPNLLLFPENTVGVNEQKDRAMVQMIAEKGKQMITEWQLNTKDYRELPLVIRKAPQICTVSWFRGLTDQK
ncbi:hypothetical protein BMS3Bbin16_00484 [archaeon BMS3Bbin16]|nr:hypothetical protein BMS3Bbin16_00484 [archaeon BMS3Bbin16]